MSTPAGNGRLFGRGMLYVVIWSLQLIIGTVTSPILAHLMAPREFGALASAIALFQVLSVLAALGLNQALILQRSEDGDGRASRGLITVSAALAVLVCATTAFTAPLWRGALGFGDFPGLVTAVILWTLPAAVVSAVLALLLTEDRIRMFALVSGLSAAGGQIIGIGLLLGVRGDATTYAWGGVASQFLAMTVGLVATRPRLRGLLAFDVTRRAIRLGVPLTLGALAFFVLNAGDRIVIQKMLGSAAAGEYQIAYVVGSVVILLLTFTNSAWMPQFAALHTDRERTLLTLHSRDALYRVLIPTVLGVTLAAPLLLRIVAPASFHPETLMPVVFLVLLAAYPIAAGGASERLLTIDRRARPLAVIAGIAAGTNIVLNIVLIPPLGITGAAAATLASYVLVAFLQLRVHPSRTGWRAPSLRLSAGVLLGVAAATATMLPPQTTGWNAARFGAALLLLPWFFHELTKARSNVHIDTAATAPGVEPSRLDGKHTGRHLPGPRRIVSFDADSEIPQPPDDRYEDALYIAWSNGVPFGTAEVDLRAGAPTMQEQLAPLLARRPAPGSHAGRRADDAALPSISVVIPTIVERIDGLAQLIAGLEEADYPDVEFLLVDNRRRVPEDDALARLVAGHPSLRIVRAPVPGIASGRNAGVQQARGEIIVFTDDDVQVDPRWLRAIGSRYAREPRLQALTGLILPAELETPAQIWYERYYGGFGGERTFTPVTLRADADAGWLLRGARIDAVDESGNLARRFPIYGIGAFAAGANMSFRRDVLAQAGGFDPALGTGTPTRGGEDLAVLIRLLWAGGEVGYEPAAVVRHRHRRTLPQLQRQLRGNGIGFTAMLTALILADPRHCATLAWQVPEALGRMARQRLAGLLRPRGGQQAAPRARATGSRSLPARAVPAPAAPPARTGYPRSLAADELLSYLAGPLAYLRSKRVFRRYTSSTPRQKEA